MWYPTTARLVFSMQIAEQGQSAAKTGKKTEEPQRDKRMCEVLDRRKLPAAWFIQLRLNTFLRNPRGYCRCWEVHPTSKS